VPRLPAPVKPDLIGFREAAAITGLSIHTMKMWVRIGRLDAWHVGPQRTMVSRAQVEAMIRPAVPAALRDRTA
jgi:predicted site-specific integrase-resolvase